MSLTRQKVVFLSRFLKSSLIVAMIVVLGRPGKPPVVFVFLQRQEVAIVGVYEFFGFVVHSVGVVFGLVGSFFKEPTNMSQGILEIYVQQNSAQTIALWGADVSLKFWSLLSTVNSHFQRGVGYQNSDESVRVFI